MKLRYVLAVIAALMILFFGAHLDFTNAGENTPEKSAGKQLPNRETLHERLFETREALLVYAATDARYREQYQQFATEMQQRGRWLKFNIRADSDVRDSDLRGTTVYLLGTVASNRWIASVAEQLPLQIRQNSFKLFENTYADSTDLLTFYYPNMRDSTHAVYLITGNSDAHLLRELQRSSRQLFNSAGDYRVQRNGQTLVMGFFSQNPEKMWAFDPENHRDYRADLQIAGGDHYRFYLHGVQFSDAEMTRIRLNHEAKFRQISEFLGIGSAPDSIDYHIFGSFEDKGLVTGNTDLTHIDAEKNAIYSVIRDGIRGDDFCSDARLLLRNHFGEAGKTVLEIGLSIYFSENWHEKGYRYWAARLWDSGNAAPLAEMLDNEQIAQDSPLVMPPLAGSFVAYLLDVWGKQQFLDRYKTWQPTATEIAKLEAGWHWHLAQLANEFRGQMAADRASFPKFGDFRKGFCFAHEGYQIYNGYLSRKSDAALAKLAEMGGNAVSITPFSFMRDPGKPAFLRFSSGSGSENDESVIHSALTAKSLGMSVMLKPHIWLGGGSWPGDIHMQSDADWQQFFNNYHRWMRHYALMAEMYQIDVLCVGVELAKTTATQGDRWREMIGKLRQLYSGQMTYAANWGDDFEKLSFWDDLDFIGLNCYYPLSDKTAPSDAELRAGVSNIAARVAAIQKKYSKPVLITEIGFTSTPSPWQQPHESARRKPVDLDAQARSYRAVFETMQHADWLRGIYWWKWPSYLEYGGNRDNDFTPNNKPAEDVVRQWYQRDSW